MNKHQRDSTGKAIKWIDTRHGKQLRARYQLYYDANLLGISSATMMQIDAIKSCPAKTPADRAKKAMAIAETIILSHQRLNSAVAAFKSRPF